MKTLIILIFSSLLFSGELEVDGDLKVTGSVESTTIDSLKMVIAQLQAQLAALQAAGGLETRIFQLPTYTFQPYLSENIITNLNDLIGMDLPFAIVTFFSLDNYTYYNENNDAGSDFQIRTEKHYISSGNDYWANDCTILNGELTLYDIYYTSHGQCNIHEHKRIKIEYGGDHGGGTFTVSIAVTAQFPN